MTIAEMDDRSIWYEATVDSNDEYFVLYHHKRTEESNNKKSTAVAKLGYWQWQEELFPVEFLTNDQTLMSEATNQLDFYLNQLSNERKDNNFSDTWRYQRYHC